MAKAMADAVDKAESVEAWGIVAKKLAQDTGIFVNGDMLHSYYNADRMMTQAGKSLCIPRVAAQVLQEIAPKALPGSGGPGVWVYKLARSMDSFFKTRMLMMSVAFTGRNIIGGVYSKAADEGLLAALNPVTNIRSAQLTHASMMANEFGSLVEAQRVLKGGLKEMRPGESKLTRAADLVKWKALWETWGLDDFVTHGIDLGDGIMRPVDEAFTLLKEQGVIGGTQARLQDLAALQSEFAAGLKNPYSWKESLQKVGSGAEDVAVTGASWAQTSGVPLVFSVGCPPAMIPKGAGRAVSAFVEQQARFANYIHWAGETKNLQTAAEHVHRNFFSMNDLNQTQRQWVRLIFPFFTWNRGNAELHLKMMVDNPQFYNRMHHFFNEFVPEYTGAVQYEEERARDKAPGTHTYLPQRVSDEGLSLRPEWKWAGVRTNIPEWLGGGPNVFVDNYGTGIEAFIAQTAPVGAMWRYGAFHNEAVNMNQKLPLWKMVGQTQGYLKFIYALGGTDPYSGKELWQMGSDATLGWEQKEALAKRGGPVGLMASHAIEDWLELEPPTLNRRATADPTANYMFLTVNPYARGERDGAALTNMTLLQSGVDFGGVEGWENIPAAKQISLQWRASGAYLGLKIAQDYPAYYQSIQDMNMKAMVGREGVGRGVLKQTETRTPR
jgi:hypothetical protein